MTSSLDCVIAVDAGFMVVEFNPAAERTFGYRERDVLGRDIAELVVPSDKREEFRRSLRKGLESDGWELLDRRIETSAMRADQSIFPVELSVTMVQGAKQDGPILYGFGP